MTQPPHTIIPFAENPLHAALAQLDFEPVADGYRRGGFLCRAEDAWLTIEDASATPPADPYRGELGQPGLWKWTIRGGQWRRVFEIPRRAISALDDDWREDDADAAPEDFLRWALATAEGEVAPAWRPPARELVESWLPSGALTVQSGGFVRQGELVLAPAHWAVRFPLLPRVAAGLPEPRRKIFQEVIADTQADWKMIRLAFSSAPGAPAVVVETNFTGAPHSELLFLAGLDGARHVVAWLVETAEALVDPNIPTPALAVALNP
jgi:hypothetical protein